MSEGIARVVLVLATLLGGIVGILSGARTGLFEVVVQGLAGAAIAGLAALAAMGVVALVVEGVATGLGRPSREPTLTDLQPLPESMPGSIRRARAYALASVCCLVLGVFALLLILWFLALVFALLARRNAGEVKRWRRVGTLLYATTTLAFVAVFLAGSGLVGLGRR